MLARSAQPWLPRYDPKTDWNLAHASSAAKSICKRSESTPIPQGNLPTMADLAGLASCNSEALYYGFAGKPDYVRARQCAYLQRAASDRNPISGSVVLAMIYANGMDVSRNLPLATKFACEAGGAPAEINARIGHLRILAGMKAEQSFDFCDDITSGYMQGVCTGVAATYRDTRREKAIEQIASSYTPTQQAAFSALRNAAANYFNEHAINEVDLSGTARGAFWIEDIEYSWNGFLLNLRTLQAEKLPTADTKAAAQADARLEAMYRRVLAEPSLRQRPPRELPPPGIPVVGGTISREGIRADQDLWLSYREAWLHFSALRKPGLASSAVKAWITDQRIHDLYCLLPFRAPGAGDCTRPRLSPSNMRE